MAMVTSKMFIEGVELNRMGQHMELARYPFHWHLAGDVKGQYIRNAAIHDTYNRCVTVHGTHNLRVENNVTYNTVGHCFFLEDGIEHGNEFVRNLAIQTKCHPTKPCVPTNLAANRREPENRQAVQAGQLRRTPCCLRTTRWRASGSPTRTTPTATTWPRVPMRTASGCRCRSTRTARSKARTRARTPGRAARRMREFKGNVAHSNFDGFMFDRNINANNTFGVTGSSHRPENPADPNSKTVENVFENLTAYKNRNGGSGAAARCTRSGT
jgi:hypothetical protein